MKIFVMSDNHGRLDNIRLALQREADTKFDLAFHLGDSEHTEEAIKTLFGDVPVDFVRGNMDSYYSTYPVDVVVNKCGHRILLTHGHEYHARNGVMYMRDVAVSREADIVVYGHTHVPDIRAFGGIWFFNPGSINFPRQENRKCTYGILTLERGQDPVFEIKSI